MATMKKDPEFGTFQDATVMVDDSDNTATVTVPMKHGVVVKLELPVPVLAAWGFDNAAGKLLGESGRIKV